MVFSYLFCVLYAYDYLCTYFKRYPSSIFANSAYRYCIFDQKLRTLGEYYSWCRTAFVRYARNPFFKRFNNCVICMYIIPMYRYDQSFVLKHQSWLMTVGTSTRHLYAVHFVTKIIVSRSTANAPIVLTNIIKQ